MKTPLRHLYRTTFWSVSMINWTKVTFINWMKKMVLGLVCIYLYMDILIATINLITENMTNVQLWVSLLVASYFGGVYRLHIYEYLHISRTLASHWNIHLGWSDHSWMVLSTGVSMSSSWSLPHLILQSADSGCLHWNLHRIKVLLRYTTAHF